MIETNKTKVAIETIQKAESLALKYQDYGFHLAFSGGKDSQVIYELCKMAGVKFRAVMQVTTIDPPEMMRFIRDNYPDVILERPEINFYDLIVKKGMLPTKQARYCCEYLKEQSGGGTVTVLGIRREESAKRAKRNELEISKHKYSNTLDQFNIDNDGQILCINGKDKIMLLPILNWTRGDVWDFIRGHKLKYCKLYDEGYHRIGCMFCPVASKKTKATDVKRYPKVKRQIEKSIDRLRERGIYDDFDNAEDVFKWWIGNENSKIHLAMKDQLKLDL